MVRSAVILGAVLLVWQSAASGQQPAADPAMASPPPSIADLARAGDARSQFLMSMRARAGPPGTPGTASQRNGIRPDPAKAFEWLRMAAQQGNTDAEFQVARAYAEGDGVARDLAKAASWYARAAEDGHALAQFNLALMRERGDGGPRDEAAAQKLYDQAAKRGLVGAMRQLAALNAGGQGGERNLMQALAWVEVAAAKAGAGAPTTEGDEVFRRFLFEQMTPEQIASAEALAKQRLASLPADPTAPLATSTPDAGGDVQPR